MTTPIAPPKLVDMTARKKVFEEARDLAFPKWKVAIEAAQGNVSRAGAAEFPDLPAKKAADAARRQVARLGLVDFARELRLASTGKAGAGRPPVKAKIKKRTGFGNAAGKPVDVGFLRNAFLRFARLDAWGDDLSDVRVRILASRKRRVTTGSAEHVEMIEEGRVLEAFDQIDVVPGTCPVDALSAVLHELAHVAACRRLGAWDKETDHGPTWREIYALAVVEVTGFSIAASHRWIQKVDDEAVAALAADPPVGQKNTDSLYTNYEIT